MTNEKEILDDIKKELADERAKLDSYAEFIRDSTKFIDEFAGDFVAWKQGQGEFVECEGCGRLRRTKTGD